MPKTKKNSKDIFCKIIEDNKSEFILTTEHWLVLKDIRPQAPVHVLIISKKHITDIISAKKQDANIMGDLLLAIQKVAKKLNLGNNRFRLIINQGRHGGQIVPHFHIHMLGGKNLGPKIVI